MNTKSDANKKSHSGGLGLYVDILMITIVIVNLIFLSFDWLFDSILFANMVQEISLPFYEFYSNEIHPEFLYYESIFITIFLIELLTQWVVSIIYDKNAKWWYYPFIHWYDVLGCLPLGYFAWLRLFRIVAMTLRLHKRGVINLRKTQVYKQIYGVYETIVHDITDRALMEMINSVQRGVKHVHDTNDENILYSGIKPNQKELAKALSSKIQNIVKNNYQLHSNDVKNQIERVIKDGFEQSKELEKLEKIPFIGNSVTQKLEDLVSDITIKLAESLHDRLSSDEIAQIIEELINTSVDSMAGTSNEQRSELDLRLSNILVEISDRILQKLKEDINTKRKERFILATPE